ncbi:MAG: glycosyltransferase family 4 protein [Alphaproteobacteria bacterium]|nr:glycosyltransferase family 4 protein [Alphaproteobacteria bacterium]
MHAESRITFLFNYGRVDRLDDGTPDEFFYGYRNLVRAGIDAALLETHPPSRGLVAEDGTVLAPPRPVQWLSRVLNRRVPAQVLRVLQLGFCAVPALRGSAAIVCITSPWLHAMRVLRLLALVRRPTVGVVIGPFPAASGLRTRLRNRLRRWLDSGSDLVFIGEGDIRAYLANINPSPKSATLIQFGIDTRFWHPAADGQGGGYAFAIGNAGRDYATLLAAWEGCETPLEIVTSRLDPDGDYPPAVRARHGIWHSSEISDADVRALFQGARFVITPLQESSQPCGQSATLQAMACGKPVILTRTTGLWDSVHLRHMDNCLLVEPGDANGLRDAVARLDSDDALRRRIGANARAAVERHFSSDMFADRLRALVESLVPPRSA